MPCFVILRRPFFPATGISRASSARSSTRRIVVVEAAGHLVRCATLQPAMGTLLVDILKPVVDLHLQLGGGQRHLEQVAFVGAEPLGKAFASLDRLPIGDRNGRCIPATAVQLVLERS